MKFPLTYHQKSNISYNQEGDDTTLYDFWDELNNRWISLSPDNLAVSATYPFNKK